MNIASSLRPVPAVAPGGRSREQRLSDLIGVIYDAAIDPSLWQCAIERSADFVGGAGAALICKDVGADHAFSPHDFGFQRPLPVAFRTDYPSRAAFPWRLEEPIATTDLIPFGSWPDRTIPSMGAASAALSISSAR